MKWRFMPLVCVALVAVLFCVYFVFFHNPTADNNSIDNTQPIIDSTTDTTQPNIDPTEPDPTTPDDDPITTDPTEPSAPIDHNNKYVGIYTDEPKSLASFENGVNTIGWFDTFDHLSSSKLSMCLDEKQYTAFITLEPAGMTLKGIANGDYDEKIIPYLMELSKGNRIKNELFIRFAHEMEMRPSYGKPWYSWQGNDPEAYIQAWRHVITLGRQYAPNVKWVWSPNRADKYTEAYYPGDEYVDYVGVTLNNTVAKYSDFSDYYDTIGQKSYIEIYNKPIIFGEVARHRHSIESQRAYIMEVLDYVKEYENCIGVVFFNKDVTRDRQYQFSHDQTTMEMFIAKAKELLSIEEA